MTDFEKAINDPHSIYKFPNDVLQDSDLTKEQKLQVLIQWEYDARALQVAEEENMTGDSPSLLSSVLQAIHTLDPTYDATKSSGTKHGGG